jgi:hypothetical protein
MEEGRNPGGLQVGGGAPMVDSGIRGGPPPADQQILQGRWLLAVPSLSSEGAAAAGAS